MTAPELATIIEAALLAAGRALTVDELVALFEGHSEAPDRAQVREALQALEKGLEDRAVELARVASGYRLQVRAEHSTWLAGLFAERPPRYSRALLETLALIAYRQPITRGEIEEVRGVAVSSNIVKTLLEREWVRVLGHREVPGRPALYGTTREFLDHFGLKSLDGLPPLAELKDLDKVEQDLFAALPPEAAGEAGTAPEHSGAVPTDAAADPAEEPGADDGAPQALDLGSEPEGEVEPAGGSEPIEDDEPDIVPEEERVAASTAAATAAEGLMAAGECEPVSGGEGEGDGDGSRAS